MSRNLNTWDVLWVNQVEMMQCRRKVASGKKTTGVIRSLINARILQLECARVLHESLLVSVFTYSSETRIWREKERSRVWAVLMDNLRGLGGWIVSGMHG